MQHPCSIPHICWCFCLAAVSWHVSWLGALLPLIRIKSEKLRAFLITGRDLSRRRRRRRRRRRKASRSFAQAGRLCVRHMGALRPADRGVTLAAEVFVKLWLLLTVVETKGVEDGALL